MRASKRIATAISFNFSFWCSSKELRRTHRPARPCKRSTCKKKTNKQKTNKQKNTLVTTYWPTSGWLRRKLIISVFLQLLLLLLLFPPVSQSSLYQMATTQTKRQTNRRTNKQITKKKKKTRIKDNCKIFTRRKALDTLSLCLTRPSQILTFRGKYSTDSVRHQTLSFVRIQFPCHIR